ncbi:hypothetical protein KDL01_34975 [Actinospica durhamensis]|uniref:Uncharacterized protein n=1 Tax=Actinospica durhamensis TaxID=1508375 RepID=A0A941EWE0_9ACTN|nr:hypothetical protein [Actinospica durhamensis]MBR7838523.1 hypothetical protein [Actinospica durhamensis]
MMPAPYDSEALWLKAKLFVNRAMDDGTPRSFDEQAMWAALALELLAKAALAWASPLLVAEPTEEGVNMLIASGLIRGEARFTTVRAVTVFKRCERAFKPFSLREATNVSEARNEYLHGSGVGFIIPNPQMWWAAFWAQAAVLISAMDREIDDFVGPDRAKVVTDHLERNKEYVKERTETLIERARQRLAQHRAGTLSAKVAAEWTRGRDLRAGFGRQADATCPACDSPGVLEGEEVTDTDIEYQGYDEMADEPIVTLTIDSEYFSCPTCHLVLDRYEFVAQAGLPKEFETAGELSDIYSGGDEYGND